MSSGEAWLACVLAFEQLEAGLRPFVQYIIEGPFIASARSLAESELGAQPQPWSQPYPSTTKGYPTSYRTWMKKPDTVAQGWFCVLFGGDGTLSTPGLHRRSPAKPPKGVDAYPWHNADEQKFADIVSPDPAKQRAAAWELAKMLIDSLDSDRAAAKAKTGVEGFAVDGLLKLIRFCKVFEESVPPLQAAGVLDVGGPLDEAGQARNHTFHPSGASSFQLTQAEKEERIGKLEAVLDLVDGGGGLPEDCRSAIAAAKARMAEMKAPGYVIGDLRRVYEMYLQTAAQIVDLKAEASEVKDEVASLAHGVAMLCSALPDNWREIAEGPLRKLGLDQLPERLDTVEEKLDLEAQLKQAVSARLQVVQEQLGRVEAVTVESAASSFAAAASSSAAAAAAQSTQAVVGAHIVGQLQREQLQLQEEEVRGAVAAAFRAKRQRLNAQQLTQAGAAGHVRLEGLGSANPADRRLSTPHGTTLPAALAQQLSALDATPGLKRAVQPLPAASPSTGGGGASATLAVASSPAGPSEDCGYAGGGASVGGSVGGGGNGSGGSGGSGAPVQASRSHRQVIFVEELARRATQLGLR